MEGKDGALVLFRFAVDVSVLLLADLLAHRQTQSNAVLVEL